MNSSPITLSQFFSSEKELWREKLSLIESAEGMSLLKDKVIKEARVKWPVVLDIAVEKITDILDISILDIMVRSWQKYADLLKYLDKRKYPPNETILVPMAKHTIKSEHHPFLEILINNQPVGKKVEFNITVTLVLEGIALKIQDGKIKGVATGTCQGKGTIKCENRLILEKKTESISLPGSIDLGEGIPIGIRTGGGES